MMFQKFYERLVGFTGENVFNPWGQCAHDDIDRFAICDRLTLLKMHLAGPARYILIGEAPGYKGCRISGIPFTSEAQLVNLGHRRLSSYPAPLAEASATIVRRSLRNLGIARETVMWNAFPFHPHQPGKPLSNRTPLRREIRAASELLYELLSQYHAWPPPKVIAVGHSARLALTIIGMQGVPTVRHPSMGGAKQFHDQLKELI